MQFIAAVSLLAAVTAAATAATEEQPAKVYFTVPSAKTGRIAVVVDGIKAKKEVVKALNKIATLQDCDGIFTLDYKTAKSKTVGRVVKQLKAKKAIPKLALRYDSKNKNDVAVTDEKIAEQLKKAKKTFKKNLKLKLKHVLFSATAPAELAARYVAAAEAADLSVVTYNLDMNDDKVVPKKAKKFAKWLKKTVQKPKKNSFLPLFTAKKAKKLASKLHGFVSRATAKNFKPSKYSKLAKAPKEGKKPAKTEEGKKVEASKKKVFVKVEDTVQQFTAPKAAPKKLSKKEAVKAKKAAKKAAKKHAEATTDATTDAPAEAEAAKLPAKAAAETPETTEGGAVTQQSGAASSMSYSSVAVAIAAIAVALL